MRKSDDTEGSKNPPPCSKARTLDRSSRPNGRRHASAHRSADSASRKYAEAPREDAGSVGIGVVEGSFDDRVFSVGSAASSRSRSGSGPSSPPPRGALGVPFSKRRGSLGGRRRPIASRTRRARGARDVRAAVASSPPPAPAPRAVGSRRRVRGRRGPPGEGLARAKVRDVVHVADERGGALERGVEDVREPRVRVRVRARGGGDDDTEAVAGDAAEARGGGGIATRADERGPPPRRARRPRRAGTRRDEGAREPRSAPSREAPCPSWDGEERAGALAHDRRGNDSIVRNQVSRGPRANDATRGARARAGPAARSSVSTSLLHSCCDSRSRRSSVRMARARRRSGARLARALVALALLGACAATVRGALLRRGASDASGARPPARAPPPPRPADGSPRRFASALSDDPLGANPAEGEAWTPELALAPTAPPARTPPPRRARRPRRRRLLAPPPRVPRSPPRARSCSSPSPRASSRPSWTTGSRTPPASGGAALSNVVVVALDAETREHARRAHPHVAVIDASEHLPRGDARRAAARRPRRRRRRRRRFASLAAAGSARTSARSTPSASLRFASSRAFSSGTRSPRVPGATTSSSPTSTSSGSATPRGTWRRASSPPPTSPPAATACSASSPTAPRWTRSARSPTPPARSSTRACCC